jgi:hypothetical protein
VGIFYVILVILGEKCGYFLEKQHFRSHSVYKYLKPSQSVAGVPKMVAKKHKTQQGIKQSRTSL